MYGRLFFVIILYVLVHCAWGKCVLKTGSDHVYAQAASDHRQRACASNIAWFRSPLAGPEEEVGMGEDAAGAVALFGAGTANGGGSAMGKGVAATAPPGVG